MAGARDLADQVVVVTGAARGIGAGLAAKLAEHGAAVALVGLEPDELERACASCGPQARWWHADVTDEPALEATAAQIREHYGRIDVVVANAGIAIGGPVLHTDLADFRRVIEVNLIGSVVTAHTFLPALIDSKGYFLQVASLAAMAASPFMAAYCASKSGVEAFAHALRAEVAHRGVGVGVAYLSWTDTDLVRGADENAAMREHRGSLPFPLGRTYTLEQSLDGLMRGIVRRSPHVYGQRWLPPMQLFRGLMPALVTRAAVRNLADVESKWLATSAGTRPVGAGGAADTASRAKPVGPAAPD